MFFGEALLAFARKKRFLAALKNLRHSFADFLGAIALQEKFHRFVQVYCHEFGSRCLLSCKILVFCI